MGLRAGLRPEVGEMGRSGWGVLVAFRPGQEEGSRGDSPYLAALAAAAGDTPGEMGHMRAQKYAFPPSPVPLLSCPHLTIGPRTCPSTPPSSVFPKVFIKLLLCPVSWCTHRKRLQAGSCREIQRCPKKE